MKSLNKLALATAVIVGISLFVPMNAKAGIMDDFSQKQNDIRFKGQVLEYKVRSFNVDEQLAKYPNKVKDVVIPEDFTVEPFSLDDYNVGHIPQLGEFKGYTDKQFEKSKAEYQSMFNNKKNGLMSQYKKEERTIDNKMKQAENNYKGTKYDLQKEYKDSVKELENLFNTKSNNLTKELDKKEQKVAKETQDNYKKDIDRINKMMKENTINYWDKEAQSNFNNAKSNYSLIKNQVESDTRLVNQLVNEFAEIEKKHYEREKELRQQFKNMDYNKEFGDFFDGVRKEQPAKWDGFIENVKRKVDTKQKNFKSHPIP